MILRNYAAVGSKIIAEKEDKGFIDLNTEKLCTHVCVNHLIEGMFKQRSIYCTYSNLILQLLNHLTVIMRFSDLKIKSEKKKPLGVLI